jgi:group I intron endonuclease
MTSTIYGLADPIEPRRIRYVGQTRKALCERLKAHRRDKKKSHKRNWIIALKRDGRLPIIIPLEICESDQANERERYHIAKCRAEGHLLLNHTDGGDGMRNWSPSEETRRRMSEAGKGKRHNLSQEGRRAISEYMRNRVVSDETRRRISKAKKGKKLPPGTGDKMSKARTGRTLSEEHKDNIRKAIKAWWAKRKSSPCEKMTPRRCA